MALIRRKKSETWENEGSSEVSKAFLTVQYFQRLSDNYNFFDSLYAVFANGGREQKI